MDITQDIRDRTEVARVAALRRAARTADDRAMAALNAARTPSVARRAIDWADLADATGEPPTLLQAELDAWITRKATT